MNRSRQLSALADILSDFAAERGIELPEGFCTEAADRADHLFEEDDPEDYGDPRYDDDDPAGPLADGTYFADPGGRSSLRAAGRDNPRNLPCPSCREPNRLTPADKARGYQCDSCADRTERGGDY